MAHVGTNEDQRRQRVEEHLKKALLELSEADLSCVTPAFHHISSARLLIKYVLETEIN